MKKNSAPDFSLILSPSKAIMEYVAFLKSHVKDSIGHGFDDEFSKAHISLFKYRDQHTESLLYHFEKHAALFSPFQVYVKDLNVFNHGDHKTIYLEIVNKNPICEIAERMFGHSITPHITIARNLNDQDFITVWKSLKNISFSDYFRCDHITVLRKLSTRWNPYMDLSFSNTSINSNIRTAPLISLPQVYQYA